VKALATDGTTLEDVEVFSCKASAKSRAMLIALVQDGDTAPRVQIPDQDFPKLFARFPVRGTETRPIPLILDAPFDLPQERDRVLMTDSDKEMIDEAYGQEIRNELERRGLQPRFVSSHCPSPPSR
jgi:hypothetical protein